MNNHRRINRRTEIRYFKKLMKLVHPEGPRCPHCRERGRVHVHEKHRQRWHVHYRCSRCDRLFNAWTGTPLQGTHRPPSEIWRIMQSIFAKESDSDLARELGRDRGKLAAFRQTLQRWMNRLPKEDFTKMATTLKKRFFYS